MIWIEDANKALGGDFLKFEEGKTQRVMGNGDGEVSEFVPVGESKTVKSVNLPVLCNGQEIMMSVTSRRLWKLIEPMIQAGLWNKNAWDITPIGDGMGKQWTVVMVK